MTPTPEDVKKAQEVLDKVMRCESLSADHANCFSSDRHIVEALAEERCRAWNEAIEQVANICDEAEVFHPEEEIVRSLWDIPHKKAIKIRKLKHPEEQTFPNGNKSEKNMENEQNITEREEQTERREG